MARVAANRPTRAPPTGPHRPGAARPAPPLPTGHGWLIRALPNEAAAYASQLESLLAEPGVADLLAAHPTTSRILRPLGRMLGLDALAPKRIRPKRTPRPEAPTAAAPRAPIPWQHQDASYRPSAKWPRKPWPAARPRRVYPA